MKHYYRFFTPVLGALLFLSENQTQSQSNLGANRTRAEAESYCDQQVEKKSGRKVPRWEAEKFPNRDKCVVQYSQH